MYYKVSLFFFSQTSLYVKGLNTVKRMLNYSIKFLLHCVIQSIFEFNFKRLFALDVNDPALKSRSF